MKFAHRQEHNLDNIKVTVISLQTVGNHGESYLLEQLLVSA